MALRIIHGSINYAEMVETGKVERLCDRREKFVKDFALKAEKSERFSKWFKPNAVGGNWEVRAGTRKKYRERFTRNE